MPWVTWLLSFISGPLLSKLVDVYKLRLDAQNSQDQKSLELAVEDIHAEIARRSAQRDLGIAAMNHPVWWLAWILFVIPVGLYHASIFLLSTFGIPPCSVAKGVVTGCFTILEVPSDQKDLSKAVIQYLFLAQAGSGVAGAVIKRLTR